jgi:peptidoglycan/LPS O-acetylase OafA/YrhL
MDDEGRISADEALTHPKYRPDIDGLRAVAILSVLVYHAFPEWFPGGFVGVDIFFVISGFLISTIIFKSLSCKEFSFSEFYSRRVRRIFPALAAVLLSAFVAGWFILLPGEYRQLGKEILGGAGFLSNFAQWRDSGYFVSEAEMKPLLHLWSLGIEEQFYIVFPLLIWVAWKIRLNILTLVVAIGLLSFLLNVKYVVTDPVWTFYQPQTRFWELMTGALLSLLVFDTSGRGEKVAAMLDRLASKVIQRNGAGLPPGVAWANCMAWLGALLLAVALYRINAETPFPGEWAALPTLGAASLIWAGPQAFLNRDFLSNPILVWLGKISYPLYLWHWVILSYLHILARGTPPLAVRGGGVFAAIGLSWLTYHFIEQPLRFGGEGRKKTFGLVAIMMSIAGIGFLTYDPDGITALRLALVKSTSPEKISTLEEARPLALRDLSENGSRCFQLPPRKDFNFFVQHECATPNDRSKTAPIVLMVGDSHSAALSLGVRPWAEARGINFFQISSGSCSLFSDDAADEDCQEYTKKTFALIQSIKPDVLLIDTHWIYGSRPKFFKNLGHWPSYADYLMDRFRFISGLGLKQVIVIGQMPTWKTDLPAILILQFVSRGQEIPVKTRVDLEPNSLDMDARMRKLDYPKQFEYLSLTDLFCDPAGCMTSVGPEMRTDLVVWDYGHLTSAGAKFVIDRKLGSMIMEALGEPKTD